jgi:hypothetical protein
MGEICCECKAVAVWVRHTQFAGDHPYCDIHAKAEKDFLAEDSTKMWEKVIDGIAANPACRKSV